MERIIRVACILALVFFVPITMGPVAHQDAYAGGGTNYKVKVTNDTKFMSRVRLTVYRPGIGEEYHSFASTAIGPGNTHTFETGDLCPSGLEGVVNIVDEVTNEVKGNCTFCTDIYGQEVTQPPFGVKSCSDANMRVIHQGNDILRGYTFRRY